MLLFTRRSANFLLKRVALGGSGFLAWSRICKYCHSSCEVKGLRLFVFCLEIRFYSEKIYISLFSYINLSILSSSIYLFTFLSFDFRISLFFWISNLLVSCDLLLKSVGIFVLLFSIEFAWSFLDSSFSTVSSLISIFSTLIEFISFSVLLFLSISKILFWTLSSFSEDVLLFFSWIVILVNVILYD